MGKRQKDLNEEINKRLAGKGIPHEERPVYRVTASAFVKAIRRGKASHNKGWQVTLHSKEEYKSMRCYLVEGGKAGVAIKKNGDIVSLFAHKEAGEGQMGKLIPFAVAHGGRKLDCFNTYLPRNYAKYGAKAVAKTPFNEKYAPVGWTKEESTPDVVAMILPSSLNSVIRRYKTNPDSNVSKAVEFKGDDGYDNMLAYRDRVLRNGGLNASGLISG